MINNLIQFSNEKFYSFLILFLLIFIYILYILFYKMNIPKWRSHLIRQNRATYSNLENHLIQITEPGNPI